MKVIHSKKGRSEKWQVKFTLDRKSYTRTFETKHMAETFADDLRGFVLDKRKTATNDGTECELGRIVFEMLEAEIGVGAITESSYVTYWNWFKNCFNDERKKTLVHHITNQWIAELKQELDLGSNGSRFKSSIVILCKVKKYIETRNSSCQPGQRRILNAPANVEMIKPKVKRKKQVQSYSFEQYKMITRYFKTCNDPKTKYKVAVILLGINSACRINELVALKWNTVDILKNTITINTTVSKALKGSRISDPKVIEKTIEQTEILSNVLKYIHEYQLVIGNPVDSFIIQPLTKSKRTYLTGVTATSVNTWLADTCKAVGIPYLSSHKAWRKTIATIIATTHSSQNPFEIAQVIGEHLGHAPGSSTALKVYIVPAMNKKLELFKIMGGDDDN